MRATQTTLFSPHQRLDAWEIKDPVRSSDGLDLVVGTSTRITNVTHTPVSRPYQRDRHAKLRRTASLVWERLYFRLS